MLLHPSLPTATIRARQQETIIPWGILTCSRWVFHSAGERVSPSGHPQLKCRRWCARKSSSWVDDRKHRSGLYQNRENIHSSSKVVCTLVLLIHWPEMKGSLWAYLWASHLFHAGDPLTEIQPIFKNNDNVCSLFLKASGFKTFFWSSEGVTNKVPMDLDAWCSGRTRKYKLGLDTENGAWEKWVDLGLDCSDNLKLLTQTLTKFSWSFQMSDQWFLRNGCFLKMYIPGEISAFLLTQG